MHVFPFSEPSRADQLRSEQVRSKLLQEIRSGLFVGADRLPSENDLADRLGVSRSVIRDALADLEREGFISRARGVGTTINQHVVNAISRLDIEVEFMTMVRDAGYTPALDHSRIYEMNATAQIAQRLNLKIREKVLVCERRILADEKPIIFARDFVSRKMLAHAGNLLNIDWTLSIFDIIEQHAGQQVTMDLTELHAVSADKELAAQLEISPQNPVIFLDEIGYNDDNRPILWSQEYYREGFMNLMILRKKI